MNLRVLGKFAAIFFVSLMLLIPISRVEYLVHERQALRDQVVLDLARGAGYAQTVTGPFLVVPYEHTVRSWTEASKEQPRKLVEEVVSSEFVFSPKQFDADGQVELQERARGIYKARVFALESKLSGVFQIEANYGVKDGVADYKFGQPYLVLALSDIRGIASGMHLRWGDSKLPFEPNTFPSGKAQPSVLPQVFAAGVHAPLPLPDANVSGGEYPFELQLSLRGTGELRFTPVGRSTRIHVASNWPHPSFTGEFLPKTREVSAEGFEATWETSFFATNLEGLLAGCRAGTSTACVEFNGKNFGVSFVDPVDHYLMSERATKYAILFVGLTFAVFFLFEVLRRTSVHPVQYGLVGLALAVFFLLLLSLSEHLGFGLAYALSAGVSVALISYYVVPILGSVGGALGFGAALSALYGVLFGILSSEDYALLTGALVVFSVLGLVMLVTRRVNWSGFGKPTPPDVSTALS